MKKILFITTYKARDFEGNGLIGYYLKKNYGIDVIYSSGYKILNKIVLHKPVAIVFDHLTWNHKVELLKNCKALGLKTIYYPTEGYYPDMTAFDYGIGLRFIDNPRMTKYLLWGSDMMGRVKCLPVFANDLESFVITGSARFDYYLNEHLKKLVVPKIEFLQKHGVEGNPAIITYMSTSPYQGYTFEDFRSRYKKNAGYAEDEIIMHYDDQQKLFVNHVNIIRKLAIELGPQYYFFYKTHPAETYFDNYKKYFGDLPNVQLIINEDVKPFIFHSDLVLQRNCTTAVESWMMGKKVIQIEDDKYVAETYNEHKTNSVICKNYDEVKLEVEAVRTSTGKRDVSNDPFLLGKFGYLDGMSHERVGNEIGKIITSMTESEEKDILIKIQQYKSSQDKLPQNRVKDLLGISRTRTLHPVSIMRVIKQKINPPKKNKKGEVDVQVQAVSELYDKLESIGI
ncbi:MAG: surface carbohydrate biosynthesis protein [Ginsengibacter sp.]